MGALLIRSSLAGVRLPKAQSAIPIRRYLTPPSASANGDGSPVWAMAPPLAFELSNTFEF